MFFMLKTFPASRYSHFMTVVKSEQTRDNKTDDKEFLSNKTVLVVCNDESHQLYTLTDVR